MVDTREFADYLGAGWPSLDPATQEKVCAFRALILEENERQNLTRLLSPQEFWLGHVLDVKALLESGFLEGPAMDLGSGGGVPGLLAALVGNSRWFLVESEGRKADFLRTAVEKLGIQERVNVFSGRGEDFLKDQRIGSVVARAVGPVERIFGWIRPCSTWNNMVLFKGRGWEEEWTRFEAGRLKGQLKIAERFDYAIGEGGETKHRVIIKLTRVPRGTLSKKVLRGTKKDENL